MKLEQERGNTFTIYQLKNGDELHYIRFQSLDRLHAAFDDAGFKSPYFPYVTAYNINYYIPGRSQTGQADITPYNFDLLAEKTKQYDLSKQKLGTERDCR